MVSQKNSTQASTVDILEMLSEGGLDKLGEVFQILFNAAMVAERQKYLGAQPHERTPTRNGHANGFKNKTLKTRIGAINLRVPQTRDGDFYPSCLLKGERSERALRLAVAEMYIQGVSTRKVAVILEELAGFEISSATVSKATAELDPMLEKWRKRPLGCYPYVSLDARYEKVRHGASVLENGVLVAMGIAPDGTREILGVSVALSEAEDHWKKFLSGLHARGLRGVRLLTSDSHRGLKAARREIFPTVPWQRCQTHLQRNAQSYVPKTEMKHAVAADIRAVFLAPDHEEAKRLLNKAIAKYERNAPKLSSWMAENIPEGLAVFNFPVEHRLRVRTTNYVERLNRELKRRTRVVSIFPNESSCLRLVTALAMEMSEEWEARPKYKARALKFD